MSAVATSSVFEAKAAAALETLGLTVAHAQLDSLAQQAAAQACVNTHQELTHLRAWN